MVKLIDRPEERRTAAFPLFYSADLSYDRWQTRSQKNWLDDRERSKAPGWLNFQPIKTWLAELPVPKNLIG
jgi:hypothetical protein